MGRGKAQRRGGGGGVGQWGAVEIKVMRMGGKRLWGESDERNSLCTGAGRSCDPLRVVVHTPTPNTPQQNKKCLIQRFLLTARAEPRPPSRLNTAYLVNNNKSDLFTRIHIRRQLLWTFPSMEAKLSKAHDVSLLVWLVHLCSDESKHTNVWYWSKDKGLKSSKTWRHGELPGGLIFASFLISSNFPLIWLLICSMHVKICMEMHVL